MIAQTLESAERLRQLADFLSDRPVQKVRTGQTPHGIIHRQNKAVVRYFPPRRDGQPGAARRRPLFISMPLINTWTIFDLLPGRSVVGALVEAGVPVYLLDWGRPGVEDQAVRMEELVDTLLPRAIERSQRHATQHHPEVMGEDGLLDSLGYCVGGTFLAISVARHGMLGQDMVRRMALLAAPIDFHASGRLSTWARPETFPLDDIIDGFGNFPKELMKSSFAMLRPTGQAAKWKGLWERGDSADFRQLWAAMEQWNGDNVDFPGETYREYVRRCYFDNALMHPELGWTMGGSPIDLSTGTVPAVAFAAGQDHICPPPAAQGLARVWGGPVRTETIKGGHVGVCIGKRFPQALLAWIDEAPATDEESA